MVLAPVSELRYKLVLRASVLGRSRIANEARAFGVFGEKRSNSTDASLSSSLGSEDSSLGSEDPSLRSSGSSCKSLLILAVVRKPLRTDTAELMLA
jgi:hypothetical protein